MESPLISVIMPAYNSAKYIAEAIDSIFRQKYTDIEIIVINDGSTDNTLEILEKFKDRIRVFSQERKGPSAARNVGLRNARGSIIGFLDSDDLWTDDHIALCLPHLLGDSVYDIAHGLTKYVRNIGADDEHIIKEIHTDASGGASLYKKSLFDKVGFFDEDMRAGEDLDMAIRICEAGGKEKRIPSTTLIYRRHETNMTNDLSVPIKGQMDALRKKMARDRQKDKQKHAQQQTPQHG